MGNSATKKIETNTIKTTTLSFLTTVLKDKKTGYLFKIYGCSGSWELLKTEGSCFTAKNKISSQILTIKEI